MAGFDCVGWNEAAPGAGTVGVARGLADQRYSEPGGDQIRVKKMAPWLLGLWYAATSTPAEARLRQTSRLQDLQFLDSQDLQSRDPYPGFTDLTSNPIKLRAGEACTALSVNATDEPTLIGALLGDQVLGYPTVITHILHGTADYTQVAVTWTDLGVITWDQDLPDGLYNVVGMKAAVYKAAAPDLGLCRMICDKFVWRPGVATRLAGGDKTVVTAAIPTVYDTWGLFKDLVFHSKAMPTFEALSTTVNTDMVIELRLQALNAKNIGQLDED